MIKRCKLPGIKDILIYVSSRVRGENRESGEEDKLKVKKQDRTKMFDHSVIQTRKELVRFQMF